jgi:regulator of protease activity HflC (stomatin/prohibitin superfamily)
VTDASTTGAAIATKKLSERLLDLAIGEILNSLLRTLVGKALAVVFMGFVAAAPFCVTQIRDYELVVLRKWGERIEGQIEPGLKWYWPFINTIHRYDIRPRLIEMNKKEQSYSGVGAQSRDGWQVGVQTFISYTLDRKKWQAVDDNFGSDDTEATRQQIEARIKLEVRNAIQNLMPQYGMDYLLDHRSELVRNIYVTLGLSDEMKPGSQEIVASDGSRVPFEVKIPSPLPIERLNQVGVVIGSIGIQFDTPPAFDELRQEGAESRTKAELANQKATQLAREQKVAEERAKLSKIEASARAEAELTLLRVREQMSPAAAFVEKWDGKLPQIITGLDVAGQQMLGALIRSRVADPIDHVTASSPKVESQKAE